MFRRPVKDPTPSEIGILKWVFVPVIVVSIVLLLFDFSTAHSKCEDVCLEKGFADSRYTPSSGRSGSPETCHCLTEEESRIKNRIPKGTRVY